MQFQVPQFLEIEDKIFGPFTFKQFVYLVGGGAICFIFLKLLGFFWGFIPIAIVAGLSIALAFWKPNNKPFIEMLEAAFMYGMQNKLYIWQKDNEKAALAKKAEQKNKADDSVIEGNIKLDGSKLRDLAWSLDVLDLKK